MARFDEPPVRRRSLLVGLALTVFLVGGWLDRSEIGQQSLGATRRLLVISDAGPVVVTTGSAITVTHRDSWLLSRPEIEIAEGPNETVVRTRCTGFTPCRSTLSVTVPAGIELVVVASQGGAHIEDFEGQVTVFSGSTDGLVTLGPLSGTARVVAGGGTVEGFGLSLGELDVEVVDARVRLEFVQAPSALSIRGGRGSTELSLPVDEYEVGVSTTKTLDVDIESTPGASRTVNIVTEGSVRAWLTKP